MITKFAHRRPSMMSPFFDDALIRDFFTPASRPAHGFVPEANIRETKSEFFVDLNAPGFAKEDFKLNLEKDRLVISAEHKEEEKKEGENYTRREFRFGSFTRMFTLPETIDTEKINASYENGILKIQLPKKSEVVQKLTRTIEVS